VEINRVKDDINKLKTEVSILTEETTSMQDSLIKERFAVNSLRGFVESRKKELDDNIVFSSFDQVLGMQRRTQKN
jgi:hypothetical protein